jgi:hypothetical protein
MDFGLGYLPEHTAFPTHTALPTHAAMGQA